MEKNSRILVTGGAGFIGSAMVRHLINNTKAKILNIDSLTYSGNLNSLIEISHSERYEFIEADIGNEEAISKLLLDFEPNIVINFAAESHVDKSIDSPSLFFETNVMGTLNLVICIKNYYQKISENKKKLFRFHHVSTDEVYGDISLEDDPVNELRAYEPSSPYAASKASSDHIVRSFHRTYALPVTISNCSNNYGPYHFPEKLIPHIIISALLGKQLPIYGDGMQIRDWLHVDDHIAGIIKIIENGTIGHTYNIGGNNEQTNINVVNSICEILDKKIFEKPNGISTFKELISHVNDRPGHDKRYSIDSLKIQKELNWTPKIEFQNGLIDTIDWYVDNKQWWEKILFNEYSLERQGKSNI